MMFVLEASVSAALQRGTLVLVTMSEKMPSLRESMDFSREVGLSQSLMAPPSAVTNAVFPKVSLMARFFGLAP